VPLTTPPLETKAAKVNFNLRNPLGQSNGHCTDEERVPVGCPTNEKATCDDRVRCLSGTEQMGWTPGTVSSFLQHSLSYYQKSNFHFQFFNFQFSIFKCKNFSLVFRNRIKCLRIRILSGQWIRIQNPDPGGQK
jgi:hypothetical protein